MLKDPESVFTSQIEDVNKKCPSKLERAKSSYTNYANSKPLKPILKKNQSFMISGSLLTQPSPQKTGMMNTKIWANSTISLKKRKSNKFSMDFTDFKNKNLTLQRDQKLSPPELKPVRVQSPIGSFLSFNDENTDLPKITQVPNQFFQKPEIEKIFSKISKLDNHKKLILSTEPCELPQTDVKTLNDNNGLGKTFGNFNYGAKSCSNARKSVLNPNFNFKMCPPFNALKSVNDQKSLNDLKSQNEFFTPPKKIDLKFSFNK